MLALTIVFLIVQALVGMGSAALFGLPPAAGVMLGTASLMGGHGTAIAWGPTIGDVHGVPGGAELGVAMATVGLIVASLLGGPIAKFLIQRHRLAPDAHAGEAVATAAIPQDAGSTGHEGADKSADAVTHVSLMRSVLWINVAILMGFVLDEALAAVGVMLPLFVPCLLSGIVLSNTLPRVATRLQWPAGTRAMSVISEFSLSVFLSMSLMSMALWTLLGSAHVLVLTVLMQSIAACLFIVFVIFPAMGGNYFAAVMAAGSTGLMLGATPTAIANMNAVTQRYGPSPLAFIVLPLVSAFFVDIANAVVIQGYLRFFG